MATAMALATTRADSAPLLRRLAWTLAGLCLAAGAAAQPQTFEPTAHADRVFTRARLTSSFNEGRDVPYVRLKLLPRSKIPFQIQTFRLKDRALIADIPIGAAVEFVAEPIDGANTVTAIRQVPECRRFEKCG